jgi:hypothetical protein
MVKFSGTTGDGSDGSYVQLEPADYERQFLELMKERHPENILTPVEMDKACLLCSESKPDKCHRRLVAEYLRAKWGNVKIQHL